MEPRALVIDIPETATSEDATRALNAPGEDFFLVQVLPIAGGHRAYLRRYKPPYTPSGKQRADADGKEAAALAIIRDNAGLPLRTIVDKLADAGITRGKDWVRRKAASMGRAEDSSRAMGG